MKKLGKENGGEAGWETAPRTCLFGCLLKVAHEGENLSLIKLINSRQLLAFIHLAKSEKKKKNKRLIMLTGLITHRAAQCAVRTTQQISLVSCVILATVAVWR